MHDSRDWWKAEVVVQSIAAEQRPVLWTEDDLTAEHLADLDGVVVPAFGVASAPDRGLPPDNLRRIEAFLRRDRIESETGRMTTAPSREELKEAHCWFPRTDRVSGQPDVTAFKQRARLHQSQWRVLRDLPIGSHSRSHVPPSENGSRIAPDGERDDDFRNFLSPAINDAVRHRSSAEEKRQEKGQQFDEARLRYDLLSSMPMCFNLFGELHGDADRLTRAGRKLFDIDEPGREVRFEHSPGRRSDAFTRDGTAFDVALFFGAHDGPRRVVGTETKYHEHLTPEKKPTEPKSVQNYHRRLERYREIARRAESDGVFNARWQDVIDTPLQQIWRDHLLLLSMLQHPSGAWSSGQYVLVHPAGHPAFAEAGAEYRERFLAPTDRTFSTRTIESLLEADVLHTSDTAAAFRERYLW